MKLLLSANIAARLSAELRRINLREIGGLLVGEHVDGETFRIVDVSVQRSGGTAAHFLRDPEQHKRFLADFFAKTGNDHLKFNYIGEWHSHPFFAALPSKTDHNTMWDIVNDPDVGVNFLILMIVRLRLRGDMQLSATLYRRGFEAELIDVTIDGRDIEPVSIWQRFLTKIRMY